MCVCGICVCTYNRQAYVWLHLGLQRPRGGLSLSSLITFDLIVLRQNLPLNLKLNIFGQQAPILHEYWVIDIGDFAWFIYEEAGCFN